MAPKGNNAVYLTDAPEPYSSYNGIPKKYKNEIICRIEKMKAGSNGKEGWTINESTKSMVYSAKSGLSSGHVAMEGFTDFKFPAESYGKELNTGVELFHQDPFKCRSYAR